MFQNEKMNDFIKNMSIEIEEHDKIYGNTWEDHQTEFLEQRLTAKFTEFKLTHNPKKLISLTNLAMLLYIRLKEDYKE